MSLYQSEGENEAVTALISNSSLPSGISKFPLIFLAAVFFNGYNSIKVANYDELLRNTNTELELPLVFIIVTK